MKICNSCKLPKEEYYPNNNVCKDCFRDRRYKHRRDNPKLVMCSSAKHRAKQKGIPFNITAEDFDIPEFCPILGIPLSQNYGTGGMKDNSPSLDKFIPELGYVKGNISVISHRANRIKHDATTEEMEKLLSWMKSKKPVLSVNAETTPLINVSEAVQDTPAIGVV